MHKIWISFPIYLSVYIFIKLKNSTLIIDNESDKLIYKNGGLIIFLSD
jgi:hypothetical protein